MTGTPDSGSARSAVPSTVAFVLAGLPALVVWPLPAAVAGALTLLPVLVLHHVATRGRGGAIGPVTAFTTGLAIDATTGGPLGATALSYLAAAALADLCGRVRAGLALSMATLAAIIAAVSLLQIVLALAVHLAPVSPWPMVVAGGLAIALLLPVSAILHLLAGRDARAGVGRRVAGGGDGGR